MKVCDAGSSIIFIFFFLFFIFLSLSRKGERFRTLISAKRFFIIAAAASSGIGVISVIVLAAKGASAGEMLVLFGISIGVGLGVALFASYIFYFLPRIYQNIQFKYLRNTLTFGVGLALFFSIGAFLMTQQNLPLFVASYVPGILLGCVSGRISIGYTKDRIVDDKHIIEWPMELNLRKYWKSYLLVVSIIAMMFLLPNIMLRSTDTSFSAFTGLFFGMMLYNLIWVITYEQRNHIRLINELRQQ